jgi:carboxyl-terminal processing protease
VKVSYASYQLLPGNIGYISITQFTGDASQVFSEAIEAFRAQEVVGLVIDVRNNPGGLLDQVVSMADAILPDGLIVCTKQRDGSRQDYYSDAKYFDVPLAVLVNGMSASASEILAGSVQALGRGTVVGLTTYGKGVVQSLQTFQSDKAGMQLTTASYFDALDRCPQGVGVKPDVEVALAGKAVSAEPDPVSDNQLAEAIALLEIGN